MIYLTKVYDKIKKKKKKKVVEMNALSKASGSLVRPRPVFSLSSWFYAPDLDMKEFEILNRASAFIVPAKCPTYRKNMFKYHIVTVSHAVAPWRWPKYYAEEWLKGVNESHCHYTIELRREDGMFMTQDNLIPHTFHHPFRDLSVLHIDDEDSFSETIEVILQTNPVQNLFSVDAEDLPSGQVRSTHKNTKKTKSKKSKKCELHSLSLIYPLVLALFLGGGICRS